MKKPDDNRPYLGEFWRLSSEPFSRVEIQALYPTYVHIVGDHFKSGGAYRINEVFHRQYERDPNQET